MVQNINNKQDFLLACKQKFVKGQWGLDEVDYFYNNREQYNLSMEEVGFLLMEAYHFSYGLAMENGSISDEENKELTQIKTYFLNNIAPQNPFEANEMKKNIALMRQKFLQLYQQEEIKENQELAKKQYDSINNEDKKRLIDPKLVAVVAAIVIAKKQKQKMVIDEYQQKLKEDVYKKEKSTPLTPLQLSPLKLTPFSKDNDPFNPKNLIK